ncbi:MAG: glycosyltransferase, partial [Magnetococcales bacterium]|nr:glycosyltransferase [Magnetococcales bacterium]
MPPVSIIIPCYNAATTIGPLLASIYNDPAFTTDDEIIVVDDHSTDNSMALARHHKALVVQTPVNSGPSIARNLGVAKAHHPILFFLDADTLLEPGSLAAVKSHFSNPDGPPCINGHCSPHSITRSIGCDYKGLVEYSWFLEAQRCSIPISCFNTRVGAMTRQAFTSVGGFNTSFNTPSVEDYEFSYRLIQHHQIVLVDNLVVRHDHPGIIGTTRAYWDRTTKWLDLFWQRKKFDSGGTSFTNAGGHMVGAAIFPSLLPALWQPWFLVVPASLFVLF